MKYKTNELDGGLLDAAVALAEGRTFEIVSTRTYWMDGITIISPGPACRVSLGYFDPSSNWADGGPIIEKYGINLLGEKSISDPHGFASWSAKIYGGYFSGTPDVLAGATTPLVAAMRAFVRAKLGDEVEL